ncbi:MAG: hypothetical protein RLZZ500_1267 [Bacteroidota bacterium]|jgi:hypothetical protein
MKSILILLLALSVRPLHHRSDLESQLLGAWKFSAMDSQDKRCFIYKKVADLSGDYFGYQILPNGKLIVKQSTSWCPVGETKITYEVVEGNWQLIHDTILEFTHQRYGEPLIDRRIIKNVDAKTVVLKHPRKY